MRIMLVEDEVKLANTLKRKLEQTGYTVDWLDNGAEALARLEVSSEDYDLAILDRLLPGREGLEICTELRKQNIQLPVIILTALGSLGDRIEGLDGGADDYLVKPFPLAELLARVRSVLRRPPASLPPLLQVRDITLDPAAHQAWRGTRVLSLTAKEFALLEFFMRHSGQVLSREQLISQLWDLNFDSFSNVVDVHMKNLRRKVDNRNNEKLFETVRGVGYRLKK
jgi:DNA-binding response OmpR family regulator